MITGELKNKIDGLWDIFAAGGLVNPLEVIEQITYLMFIHDLDDSDNKKAKDSAMLGLPYESIFGEQVKIGERTIDGTQLKWSVFHDFPADKNKSEQAFENDGNRFADDSDQHFAQRACFSRNRCVGQVSALRHHSASGSCGRNMEQPERCRNRRCS